MNIIRLISLHILFLFPILVQAQTKRALVIGIGKQEDSTWNKINGDKDVPYVLEMLNAANYGQIITCVNEEATKSGHKEKDSIRVPTHVFYISVICFISLFCFFICTVTANIHLLNSDLLWKIFGWSIGITIVSIVLIIAVPKLMEQAK